MDVAAYVRQLAGLLPQGAIWQAADGSVLRRFLLGVADELARVDWRAQALLDEWDPRTVFELLAEWERVYGLPDGCTDESSAVAQRRATLVARVVATGGQSPAYLIAVAAAMGFAITIEEFTPATVEMACDDELCGEAWAYAFRVHGPLNTVTEWTVDDPLSEALAWWGTEILECVLSRLKPAHTRILFAYA